VPRRRTAPAKCPMAIAKINGRTSSHGGGPPSASIAPGPSGARPTMAMPRTRPAIRRGEPRAPTSWRRMGCDRARLSPWRPRPSCRRPISRPARPPCASPVDPPPPVQVPGCWQRPWPAPRGRRAACGPRRHRPSPVRGPARKWPRAAAPSMGSPLGPWWCTRAVRSNGGRRRWRVRARRRIRRSKRPCARRPHRRMAAVQRRRLLPPRGGRTRAPLTGWQCEARSTPSRALAGRARSSPAWSTRGGMACRLGATSGRRSAPARCKSWAVVCG
jgi:hypothetical protein